MKSKGIFLLLCQHLSIPSGPLERDKNSIDNGIFCVLSTVCEQRERPATVVRVEDQDQVVCARAVTTTLQLLTWELGTSTIATSE